MITRRRLQYHRPITIAQSRLGNTRAAYRRIHSIAPRAHTVGRVASQPRVTFPSRPLTILNAPFTTTATMASATSFYDFKPLDSMFLLLLLRPSPQLPPLSMSLYSYSWVPRTRAYGIRHSAFYVCGKPEVSASRKLRSDAESRRTAGPTTTSKAKATIWPKRPSHPVDERRGKDKNHS